MAFFKSNNPDHMKKLFPLLLLSIMASCRKEELNPQLIKTFTIQSTTNGANYKIQVALPENYHPENNRYATIYILDGQENFDFVAEECKKISNDYSSENVLVVSIGYGYDRTIDYTPTDADEGDGGAEKFMLFIKDELIPKMESGFSADSLRESRTILGHSFGGLCAAYAFTNHNSVFGNYILLSPSIWYDNEIMLKLEQQNRDANKSNKQLVFMGIGEMERSGRMFAPYEAFYRRLKNNYPAMTIKSHVESHLDHVGSKNPNIIEGLNFYFQN